MRAPKPRPREERTGREEAPSASRTRSPLPKAVADRRRWQGATTRNSWRYSEEEQRSQRRRDAAELGDGFRVRDTRGSRNRAPPCASEVVVPSLGARQVPRAVVDICPPTGYSPHGVLPPRRPFRTTEDLRNEPNFSRLPEERERTHLDTLPHGGIRPSAGIVERAARHEPCAGGRRIEALRPPAPLQGADGTDT